MQFGNTDGHFMKGFPEKITIAYLEVNKIKISENRMLKEKENFAF